MSLLRKPSRTAHPRKTIGGPLVWTFDGAFATCLADMEDALRRAIVQVGDVSSIAVLIELSLPRLQRRVVAGDVDPAGVGPISRAVVGSLRLAIAAADSRAGSRRAAGHAGHRLSGLAPRQARKEMQIMKLKSWMVNKANKADDHGPDRDGSASVPGTDMLEPRMRAPGSQRAPTRRRRRSTWALTAP